MNNENNFKVICMDTCGWHNVTKGKIYEFKDGKTSWDNGAVSYTYKNYKELFDCFKVLSTNLFVLVED